MLNMASNTKGQFAASNSSVEGGREVDVDGEDNAGASLADALGAVKLKGGLELSQLCSDQGANFEISEDQMESMPEVMSDKYFDDEVFKYAKMELVGGDSDDDDEDNDNDKDALAPGKMQMTPFGKLAAKMEDISPDASGGVLKQVLLPGIGELPPEGAFVTVHYNAYLEFNPEPFDSTPLRGRKLRFRLGSGKVILGLDIGICTMKAQEKAHFLVKPDYAYGPMGCPPRIPAAATILFEVELFSFIDNKAMVDFSALPVDEKNEANFTTVLRACEGERLTGNDHFNQKHYDKATDCYTRAINYLERRDLENEDEQEKCNELLLTLYQNAALAFERLKKYKKVKTLCEAALEIDSNSIKSLVRLGRTLTTTGDYKTARSHLLKAQKISPQDAAIQDALKQLDDHQRKAKATEQKFCARMFSALSKAKEEESGSSTVTPPKEILPALNVSEDFQNLVYDQLNDFANSNQQELCLPGGLSPGEHACVAATAKVLGLTVNHQGRPGSLTIKVVKRPKKT